MSGKCWSQCSYECRTRKVRTLKRRGLNVFVSSGNTVVMRRRAQVVPGIAQRSTFDNTFSLRNHF